MDDFSLPGPADEDGLEPNADNYPVPGKRPLSSMVPTIMLDEANDSVRLVIGGAGSQRILTGTTFVSVDSHIKVRDRCSYCFKSELFLNTFSD